MKFLRPLHRVLEAEGVGLRVHKVWGSEFRVVYVACRFGDSGPCWESMYSPLDLRGPLVPPIGPREGHYLDSRPSRHGILFMSFLHDLSISECVGKPGSFKSSEHGMQQSSAFSAAASLSSRVAAPCPAHFQPGSSA